MLIFPFISVATVCLIFTMFVGISLKVRRFSTLMALDFAVTLVVLLGLAYWLDREGAPGNALGLAAAVAAATAIIGFGIRWVIERAEGKGDHPFPQP